MLHGTNPNVVFYTIPILQDIGKLEKHDGSGKDKPPFLSLIKSTP